MPFTSQVEEKIKTLQEWKDKFEKKSSKYKDLKKEKKCWDKEKVKQEKDMSTFRGNLMKCDLLLMPLQKLLLRSCEKATTRGEYPNQVL